MSLSRPYDPIYYWQRAGRDYYKNFRYNDDFMKQEVRLAAYIHDLEGVKSVLELGCGFGRITKLVTQLLRPKRYLALDISRHQLAQAEAQCNKVEFIQDNIETFQTDEKFDLVIAIEVLMHMLPSKIQEIIDKMILFSKRHVLSVDYYNNENVKLAEHNFNHDYPSLYKNANMIDIGTGQSIFHLEKCEP